MQDSIVANKPEAAVARHLEVCVARQLEVCVARQMEICVGWTAECLSAVAGVSSSERDVLLCDHWCRVPSRRVNGAFPATSSNKS